MIKISTDSESTGSGLNVKRNYGGFYEKGTNACQQVTGMMLARKTLGSKREEWYNKLSLMSFPQITTNKKNDNKKYFSIKGNFIMRQKFNLFKIGIFLAIILGLSVSVEAQAQTNSWTGATDNDWGTVTNWSLGHVPLATEDVTIPAAGNVTVEIPNTQVFRCKTLTLPANTGGAGNATLLSNTSNQYAQLHVLGNITIATDADDDLWIDDAQGTGSLNITVGDTTATSNISCIIDIGEATTAGTDGFNVNNLRLYNATVQYKVAAAVDVVNIAGNLTLEGTSTFTPETAETGVITFVGATTKVIDRSATSFIDFANLDIPAGTVTTNDDITCSDALSIAGTFTQTSPGTFFYENTTGGIHADALNITGTASFYNLNVNCTTDDITSPNATHSDITVTGNFTKTGAGLFSNASKIIFDNSSPKTITVSGGQDKMITEGFEIAASSRITTNSSFTLGTAAVVPTMEVKALGSFSAATGEILFDNQFGAGSITNLDAQDSSLKFFDVEIAGGGNSTTSQSDFKVGGDFLVGAGTSFDGQQGSKVTFENNVQKTLTGTGTTIFCELAVAANSDVTCGTAIAISNNNNAVASGIDVGAAGKLTFTANSVTIGETGEGATDKNIVVASDGELNFTNLIIADLANNDVKTASNFTITGAGAAALSCIAATAGTFEATAGTITFTGASPVIIGDDASFALSLNNIVCTDSDVTITAADWLSVTGDITLNGTSSFKALAETTDIQLNGAALQTLGGNTSDANPFEFGVLILNKGAEVDPVDYVKLERDVIFIDNAASTLTLTAGVLDLGTQNFTHGTGVIARTTGVIHGRTGTFIINKAFATLTFGDALFTVAGEPTLYNLDVGTTNAGENEVMDADLTINNELDLINGDLDIATFTLTVKGNITQTLVSEIIDFTAGATAGKVILEGSGTTGNLSNTLFHNGTGNFAPNLEIKRNETLAGDIIIDDQCTLTMNSGNKQLDLSTNTLEFRDNASPAFINVVSGTIVSSTGSKVIFNDNQPIVPANMFFNNAVQDVEFKAAIELGGDLTINGAQTGAFDVTTGTNVLTLGPSATEAFTDDEHVIGRLRRTVTGATSTLFEIGGGATNDYRGVEIKFSNSSTSQIVEVSSNTQNPTTGRVGNPEDALNATWTITPQGTVSNALDSVNVKFLWGSNHMNGLALGKLNPANLAEVETFATRYKDNAWVDYSTSHAGATSVVDGDPDQLLMNGWAAYPLNSTDFGGTWAVFDDDSPATHADALETSGNKLVFTSMPSNIGAGLPFSATVEYQDQFGNPVLANSTDGAMTVQIKSISALVITGTTIDAVIPVGSSSVIFNGITLATASTEDVQIKATATTAAYSTTKIGISPQIDVLSAEPSISGRMITFTVIENRALTFTVEGGAAQNAIIVAKQTSAIATTDFPVDGQTYVGNQTMGAGSVIGNGVVVFKGAVVTGANTVKVSGLAPMTTYHFRVFTYAGDKGTENYRTIPGPLSFNSKATIGTTDDDVEYGSNNTQADAKPIGTNTEVQGRISSSTDVDWFSFTVTSAAANIRVKLTNVPTAKNYNLEIYNAAGRRVRRGMLKGTANESLVINDLVSGTYSVRVYGQDSDNDATNAYKVKVETKGTEIFSVTQ